MGAELGACCSDIEHGEPFAKRSISQLPGAPIAPLSATEGARNHGCIQGFAMNAHSCLAISSSTQLAGHVRRRPERPRTPLCSLERLETLDAELTSRAREAGRLRFEMGRGLDLLERTGGDHALGFSSIEAYALERCERSASWTQRARGLARRLEGLPAVADALISGSLNWTMATLLATVASPDDADFWLGEVSSPRVTRETLRRSRSHRRGTEPQLRQHRRVSDDSRGTR